jgi:hypothetical protein
MGDYGALAGQIGVGKVREGGRGNWRLSEVCGLSILGDGILISIAA